MRGLRSVTPLIESNARHCNLGKALLIVTIDSSVSSIECHSTYIVYLPILLILRVSKFTSF